MYAPLRPSHPPPGESLRVLHLRSPGFGPLWHHHEAFELNVIVAGAGTRWIAGSAERFGPGDIVLVPPGMPHSWASDVANPIDVSEAVVVLFPPDLVGASGLLELGRVRALLDAAAGHGTGAGFAFADPTGQIAAAVRSLPRRRGAKRVLLFLDLLDRLAAAERRPLSIGAAFFGVDARERALVARAIALVGGATRKAPRQAEVASLLGLSPSSFSRLFRRATGLTYSAFVDGRRIDSACVLLQRGELAIVQVAHAVGFDNLSNFNRRFRVAKGETPSAYRRHFQEAMR